MHFIEMEKNMKNRLGPFIVSMDPPAVYHANLPENLLEIM
jgi:hypothetical protein